MTMACAAVFDGKDRSFRVEEYEVVDPVAGEVLLSLERSGICGTDVHIAEGRLAMPEQDLIIGHEFTGRIEKLGEGVSVDGLGNPLAVGDYAIACVAIACGECVNCKRGETASCLAFGVTYVKDPADAPHLHGGYGEFQHCPAANLVKIPEGVDLDAVAALPCAGPTLIRAYTYAGGLEAGELVVVQGAGPLGLFATAYAVKAGCTVVVIGSGSNPERQALARSLGAHTVLDYREVDEEARLKIVQDLAAELGRGNGADVVVETSGSPKAVPEALNLVRTRGRYIVPGQYSASGGVTINPELITFKAIRITGSGQYQLSDLGTYTQFIAENKDIEATFAKCITHRYSVKEIETAMSDAAEGRSIKGVFVR
ncbi:MAG: zinc-binding dehydrogenase [Planctomycetota bacterium]|jgi:D-arabinose 1-dehydrogenase-like Zn-dependent alcohol dehydrogenase